MHIVYRVIFINGTYYSSPVFPNNNIETKSDDKIINISEFLFELLNNNIGKIIKVYLNINSELKELEGKIESSNNNYLYLNDINNKKKYLISNKYICYIETTENMN